MLTTNPDTLYCGCRCAKRSRFVFDPERSRRPIVACTVCGRRFTQEAALGRLRVCCPLHYGGYRSCAACGARCRPRGGRNLCRKCKKNQSRPRASDGAMPGGERRLMPVFLLDWLQDRGLGRKLTRWPEQKAEPGTSLPSRLLQPARRNPGRQFRAAALARQRTDPAYRRRYRQEDGLPRPHHHHPGTADGPITDPDLLPFLSPIDWDGALGRRLAGSPSLGTTRGLRLNRQIQGRHGAQQDLSVGYITFSQATPAWPRTS